MLDWTTEPEPWSLNMASRPIAIDDDTSIHGELASGKRLHNYGKSPFLMGKSTINGHVPYS